MNATDTPVATSEAPRTPATATMETWSRRLDLRDLATRFGTPLYVHAPARLLENLERWGRLVGAPERVYYPVKANPSPTVLDRLAAAGTGADCASRTEVRAALAAGIPLERLSYTSPAMDGPLAGWLLASGATVVADSPAGLAEIARRFEGSEPFRGSLAVRVNPGGLPGYKHASEVQRYTDHGSATGQFGIPSEEVVELLGSYPLPVTGLHTHVGTQMDNVDTFVAALELLHALADLVSSETRHRVSTVNLGGGLGIPFFTGQEIPSVEALAHELRPRLRGGLVYRVEPGNALVGDAMALLGRLVAVKETRGRRWGILDVGTDQLVKHTVARWEHEIVGPDHEPLARSGPDALAGPLCFAGDVLLPQTDLSGLAEGDPLLVRHAGAYCEAVASRFNGRRGPAHVEVDEEGEARLVRRREDLFFAPERHSVVPVGLEVREEEGEELPAGSWESLQSEYMQRLAEEESYSVRSMRRTGPGAYLVTVEPRTPVPFVAMPLALRIVGDSAIIAVGRELGWSEKRAPLWATRLALQNQRVLASDGTFPCRLVVEHLAPSPLPEVAGTVDVHFRLGDGEVSGVARVAVPEEAL